MAVFAGKARITNGGSQDNAMFNSFYWYPATVGNVIHCYSGALGTGTGIEPTDAVTTLALAQTAATADNGDMVLVLPGHTETIAGAAGITFTKAGIIYQGLGTGTKRPTLTWSATDSTVLITTAARITFRNIVFDFTGVDLIVAAMTITAADVTFEECEFVMSNATKAAILGIVTGATATRLRISKCRFLGAQTTTGGTGNAGNTAMIQHEIGDDAEISDCWMTGKCTQAILNATASVLRLRLLRNCIHVYTGVVVCTLDTTCTGFAADNRFCVASGTDPCTGAGLSYSGNHYTTEGNGPTGGTADAF